MARYASDTKVEFPELQAIRDELKARFSPSVRAKFLGAALKAATDPTAKDLKNNTKAAFGKVTGNLYRSVTSVVKRYPKTGNAVGLVGYRKSGTSKLMFSRGMCDVVLIMPTTLACLFSEQNPDAQSEKA